GGVSSTGNLVYLTGPAPSTGAVVTLSSAAPSATVPASVTVPAGATSARFNIATTNVAAPTSVTISASYGGVTKTATLTVNPVAVLSVVLSPTALTGGATSTSNTVTLNGPAPPGGAVITLSSSLPCATVPNTVTAPAGATSVKFNVVTTAVAGATTVTISAT